MVAKEVARHTAAQKPMHEQHIPSYFIISGLGDYQDPKNSASDEIVELLTTMYGQLETYDQDFLAKMLGAEIKDGKPHRIEANPRYSTHLTIRLLFTAALTCEEANQALLTGRKAFSAFKFRST